MARFLGIAIACALTYIIVMLSVGFWGSIANM
jgi:hypothetical protein